MDNIYQVLARLWFNLNGLFELLDAVTSVGPNYIHSRVLIWTETCEQLPASGVVLWQSKWKLELESQVRMPGIKIQFSYPAAASDSELMVLFSTCSRRPYLRDIISHELVALAQEFFVCTEGISTPTFHFCPWPAQLLVQFHACAWYRSISVRALSIPIAAKVSLDIDSFALLLHQPRREYSRNENWQSDLVIIVKAVRVSDTRRNLVVRMRSTLIFAISLGPYSN